METLRRAADTATFDVTDDLLDSVKLMTKYTPPDHARGAWLSERAGQAETQPYRVWGATRSGTGRGTIRLTGFTRCPPEHLHAPVRDLIECRRTTIIDRLPEWSYDPNTPRWVMAFGIGRDELYDRMVRLWWFSDRLGWAHSVTYNGRAARVPRPTGHSVVAQRLQEIRTEVAALSRRSMMEQLDRTPEHFNGPPASWKYSLTERMPTSQVPWAYLIIQGRTSYDPHALLAPLFSLLGQPATLSSTPDAHWTITAPIAFDPRHSEILRAKLAARRFLEQVDPEAGRLDYRTAPLSVSNGVGR